MLGACNPKTELGAPDWGIILCLWDSGCRASEFIALNYDDLDPGTGALLVRSGKGRKRRVTFLGALSRRQLLRYLRFRGEMMPSHPLFATKTRTRLAYNSLRHILLRRAKDAGVEAVSLYAFGRFFALHTLRNGADVFSLQRLMGHTNRSVLRRYLRQTQDDLQKVHEKSGPVDHLLR